MRIKNLTFNMVPNSLRHPTESGQYLVVTVHQDFHNRYKVAYMTVLRYSKKRDMWNVDDVDAYTHTQIPHERILAWTPFKHIVDDLQPMVNEYNKEAAHEQ